jgi:hypothetical protein
MAQLFLVQCDLSFDSSISELHTTFIATALIESANVCMIYGAVKAGEQKTTLHRIHGEQISFTLHPSIVKRL